MRGRALDRVAGVRAGPTVLCVFVLGVLLLGGFSTGAAQASPDGLVAPSAAVSAAGCTNPPGSPGQWRYDGAQNQWYVCVEVAPGQYSWRPASGEPGAPIIASPQLQSELRSDAVTHFTVSVLQDPSRPLTLVMNFGDGASQTVAVPQGSGYSVYSFSHSFYHPLVPSGPSVGAYNQTATVQQTGISDSSTTVHAC